MITKKTFINLLGCIKNQMEFDEEVGRNITAIIDPEFAGGAIFTTPLIQSVLVNLTEELHDKWGHISYFVYEVDWGRRADERFLTLDGGRIVKFYNAGVLYDYLMEEDKIKPAPLIEA